MDWKRYWNDDPRVRVADFRTQVGRTFLGEPYADRVIEAMADRLVSHLEAGQQKTLLDLACGNGLITSRLAPHFSTVKAVDFSRPLIEVARAHFARDNIDYVLGDALDPSVLGKERYDCVLVGAALQYFSPSQVHRMFQDLRGVVTPGGRIVLGDVADRDRRWNFYRGFVGRSRFVLDFMRGTPIIGYWWSPSALLKMAEEMDWRLSILYQPPDLPNHYFRYDAILEVPSR